MKLQILSDIHNEFSVLPIPKTEADIVILAGDIDVKLRAIEWAKEFNKPVIYVLGNHEFYKGQIESIKKKTRKLCEGTQIHFLDDEEIIINGVRFLAGTLWTDFKLFGNSSQDLSMLSAQFSMSDYKVIRTGFGYRKLRPSDTVEFHEKTLNFLTEKLKEPFSGKTVVVTHHAPSLKSIHERYLLDKLTPAYASNLDYLMGELIALWVHGHTHHRNDYVLNGTRVVSNPRGYHSQGDSENQDFNPEFIVEI